MQVESSNDEPVIRSSGLNRHRTEMNLRIPVGIEDLRSLHRLLYLGSRIRRHLGIDNAKLARVHAKLHRGAGGFCYLTCFDGRFNVMIMCKG